MNKNLHKNDIRRLIILASVLLLYIVIIFVVNTTKNGTFWLGFVFTLIAFALAYFLFKIVSNSTDSAKSRFYRIPIVKVGFYYIAVQLVLGLLETLLAQYISWKAALIINLFVIVAAIIGTVAADTMREEIERQDTVIKKQVKTIRNLQSLSASLVGMSNDMDTKVVLQKIADDFRYSDPVSNESTEALEEELESMLNEIQSALVDGELESARELAVKIQPKLNERNRICKLSK